MADVPYSADEIQVLRGVEAVRKRPGMYVGDVADGSGLQVMLWEVVGNAVDEFLAGHARHIRIAIDGARVTVEDDGRGIPVDGLEHVMTCLHAGSSWREHHVHLCGGLHGVGVTAVNALSSELEATTWHAGFAYRQRYARGDALGPVEQGSAVATTGTRISFVPDFTILARHAWDVDAIAARCSTLAALLPGLAITVNETSYRYESLVDHVEEVAQCDVIDPFVVRAEHDGVGIDLAIAWTRGATSSFAALVNCSPCEHGTHVDALFGALRAVLAPRLPASTAATFRKRISRGMVGVLHVRLVDPIFGSPTRDWLKRPDVGAKVQAVVERGFARHLDETPALLDALLLDLAPARRARVTVRLDGRGP